MAAQWRAYSASMDTPQLPDEDVEDLERQHDVATRRRERGQGMVEYAFILILVAVVALVAVQALGHTTQNLYSNISNGLNP